MRKNPAHTLKTLTLVFWQRHPLIVVVVVCLFPGAHHQDWNRVERVCTRTRENATPAAAPPAGTHPAPDTGGAETASKWHHRARWIRVPPPTAQLFGRLADRATNMFEWCSRTVSMTDSHGAAAATAAAARDSGRKRFERA